MADERLFSERLRTLPQPTAFAHSWGMPPAARRRRRSDSRSQTFGPESSLSRSVVGTGSAPFDIAGCTCKQSSSKRHVALSMGFSGPVSYTHLRAHETVLDLV